MRFRVAKAGLCIWAVLALAVAVWAFSSPRPHFVPVDHRTTGVPGCSEHTVRAEVVPAGATVAFSCPTHIVVESQDEHTPTKLVWSR